VIVVDNASDDGTSEAVAGRGVDVLRLERPAGLAAAYNRGAERTRADLILFLNDDVLVNRESLSTLVQALAARPTAVAAAGRLVDAKDGRTQTGYLPQAFPTLRGLVAMLAGGAPRRATVGEIETVAVDHPVGACLLVRRTAFAAVGGWDEEFEFWYEDVDLARRLRVHGELLYVPAAPFVHVGGHTAQRLSRAQLVSRHYRGALLYAAKHFGRAERLGAGLAYALAAAGKLPLTRESESRRVYGRVFRNGLRVAAGRRPLPP
jgi:N-acetylglucosaminyl-diphospho-decaprenol L-rhamnosyltransferase